MLSPDKIVEVLRVPTEHGHASPVFALVPRAGPVSFYSQQKRAFNLVAALHHEKLIQPAKTVAVIGAGLAGITVSAAAHMLGCMVTVFETNQIPFHQQRGNHTRYIHPNVIDWPQAGSELLETQLPFLNWKADDCTRVIDEIEDQWQALDIVTHYKRQVHIAEMEVDGAYVVASQPYHRKKFDVVVITVGFGQESQFGLKGQKTYWSNDDLHQHLTNADEQIFISGIGDGGLIDAMRLALLRFDHGEVVQEVMRHRPLLEIRDELLAIDRDARTILKNTSIAPAKREAKASDLIWEKYVELGLPQRLPRLERRDNVRKIVLNSSLPTPMNINASIINRVIVHGLVSDGVIAYEQGSLAPFADGIFGGQVRLERVARPELDHIDKIIIRHGPMGALSSVVGEDLTRAYFSKSSDVDQTGRFLALRPDLFRIPENVLQAPTRSLNRATRLLPEFEAWLDKFNIAFGRVSIRADEETGGPAFAVTVNDEGMAKLKAQPALYHRVPITVEIDSSLPIRHPELPDIKRLRPLVCGTGISAWSSGTLGCFVTAPDGKPAIVTVAHVLSSLRDPEREQVVIQPWHFSEEHRDADVIARVTKVLPLHEDGRNHFDIGYATLEPGVEFVQCCDPSLQTPAFRRVIEMDASLLGSPVFLAGPNKIIHGKIVGIDAVINDVAFSHGRFGFEKVIVISDFDVRPGDFPAASGSIVATKDGSVVGMTFAGTEADDSLTLCAFALAPALRELKCEFISFST